MIDHKMDQKQRKKTRPTPCYISKLPNHILKQILCKLPFTSLTQCRYVCKSWKQILLDLDFVKLHLSIRKPSDLFICAKEKNLYWLEFHGETHYFNLAAEIKWNYDSLRFLNSCNGLVCVCQDSTVLHVINPLTCEYVSLPPCRKGWTLFPNLCGLGFDSKTQKFKVVRASWNRKPCFNIRNYLVHVCTLGDSIWRRIVELPNLELPFWDSLHAFLNGSLHCIANSGADGLQVICSFDFEREQFRLLHLPAYYYNIDYNYDDVDDDDGDDEDDDDDDSMNNNRDNGLCGLINVGVCRDSLCFNFFTNSSEAFIEVWLMKEYGKPKSWTKMLVIENSMMWGNMWAEPEPIRLLDNGDFLLHQLPDLGLYNPETRNSWKLGGRMQSTICPIAHSPRFASIKDILGELEGFKCNIKTLK